MEADNTLCSDQTCSFSNFHRHICGPSIYYPSESSLSPISNCLKDISSHLRSLNLCNSHIPTEGHLLCFRVGIFSYKSAEHFSICPKLRAELGVMWKKGHTCAYPDHIGKAKPERPITPLMSHFILARKGVMVPVGSGICRKCRGVMYEEMKNTNMLNKDFCGNEEDSCPDFNSEVKSDPLCLNHQQSTTCTLQCNTNRCKEQCSSDSVSRKEEEQRDLKGHSEEESIHSSQPLSQVSSWSEENIETSLDDINKTMGSLSRGSFSPLKYQVRRNLDSLMPNTLRTLKRKTGEAINLVLEGIAPGQGNKLLKLIQEPSNAETNCDLEKVVVNLYLESSDKDIKKQLLSLISLSHTKKELQQLIPQLSIYAIDEARTYAADHSKGTHSHKRPVFHHRMDKVKLDHALDFFFNPAFHQVSSVGTKEIKLDDGSLVTIPEVVRTVWNSALVKMYLSFCEETEFAPLSRSTLFHVLSVCPASKCTNLKGLDNVAAEGGHAYEILLSTVADMEKYAPNALLHTELKELKDSLLASRMYLKTEFKAHLKQFDSCADHCISFALSDPGDECLQQNCLDHDHDVLCDKCSLLPQTVIKLKEIMKRFDICATVKEDMLADIDVAEIKISEWKNHIVRGMNQDLARTHRLQEIQHGDVLLIMDWAMKFLPISYREKQSDWYGQKGVNWHVSVCIYKDEALNLKHRTFAHMMDGVRQDWMTVACLLEHTLSEIKKQLPTISRAYIRSDNAGCYHCGNLWLAIPGISERTAVSIARYDYSEAQNGKSYCDAKIAHMRSKFRKVAASGYDITTAADMKRAIDMFGGTTGCQAAHVEISSGITTSKCPIKGITKISNVQFEGNSLQIWRAFRVGKGNVLAIPHENSELSTIKEKAGFTTISPEGNIREPKLEECCSEERKFPCSEGGCTKVFSSFNDLQNHILIGSHDILSQMSTYDDIKVRWKNVCSDLSGKIISYACKEVTEGESKCCMGWALKKERKSVRYSDDIKDYLQEIFHAGESSGMKLHPSIVAQNMRVALNKEGNKRFKPQEYLELGQISSYFSRLTAERKKRKNVEISEEELESILLDIRKVETTTILESDT